MRAKSIFEISESIACLTGTCCNKVFADYLSDLIILARPQYIWQTSTAIPANGSIFLGNIIPEGAEVFSFSVEGVEYRPDEGTTQYSWFYDPTSMYLTTHNAIDANAALRFGYFNP